MKFQLVAPDCHYETGLLHGGVNGGTVWLDNIAKALRYWGHDAELLQIDKDIKADYLLIQGEFVDNEKVVNFKRDGGKVITLLSHFNCPHYPSLERIKELSDFIATPWEGEVCYSVEAYFMPHAYNDLDEDDQTSQDFQGEIIFVGNTYELRHEGWIDKIGVTRLKGIHPALLPPVYRGANVCLNIHGDFQKNIVSDKPSRVADKPGVMINERFWSVLGSGGLLITDWVPQMDKWFSEADLLAYKTEEEFREKVAYYNKHKEEGLEKLKKARELVRKKHTYRHRVKGLLKYMDLC